MQNFNLFQQKRNAVIGALGALLGVVGDLLLLYSPDGGFTEPGYPYLAQLPAERVLAGTLIGILGIPLQGFGVWMLAEAVSEACRFAKNFVLVGGLFVLLQGVAIHAGFGYLAVLHRVVENAHLHPEFIFGISILNTGVGVLLIALLALMLVFIRAVWVGPSRLPRKILYFNPLVIYTLCAVLWFTVPSIGYFLLPAGFNIAFGMLFVLSYFWLQPVGR
jgi:hypothetical protein